jgi:hypothetical protein
VKAMFYRRKYYVVKNEFVEKLNLLFKETNYPNQMKHGARLVGRWMVPKSDTATEVFAIWEYDSYERYIEIEEKVRGDVEHVKRIKAWYEKYGGRDRVYQEYIVEVRNEKLTSTLHD